VYMLWPSASESGFSGVGGVPAPLAPPSGRTLPRNSPNLAAHNSCSPSTSCDRGRRNTTERGRHGAHV
jgi:hypothetical protein